MALIATLSTVIVTAVAVADSTDPLSWGKALLDLGAIGAFLLLAAFFLWLVSKQILPWLDKRDERAASLLKSVTSEFREALRENNQAIRGIQSEVHEMRGDLDRHIQSRRKESSDDEE